MQRPNNTKAPPGSGAFERIERGDGGGGRPSVSTLPRTADEAVELRNLIVLASHLADDIAGRSERERAIAEAAWAAGCRAGHECGYEMGWAACDASYAASWHPIAERVRDLGPTHAELELRRWGPGGRARFGDPRPGDYRGKAS